MSSVWYAWVGLSVSIELRKAFLAINHSWFVYSDKQYAQYVKRVVMGETGSGNCVFK